VCRFLLSCAIAGLAVTPLTALHRQDPDFTAAASRAFQERRWDDLVRLSEERLAAADGGQVEAALTYLALGRTGAGDVAGAVEALRRLEERGADPDEPVAGGDPPLQGVLSVLWNRMWADFDPQANRREFGPLFEAFPDSSAAPLCASRLLMAALELGDDAEAHRLDEWFDDALAAAEECGDRAARRALLQRWVRGHLLAEDADATVRSRAEDLWRDAWAAACREYGFDGPPTGGGLDEDACRRRLECELDTDDAYGLLIRATVLAGEGVPAGSPLLEIEDEPGARFEDVTAAVGLSGLAVTRVASADYDGDGDPDLCLAGRLFENRKGRFFEVGKEQGVTRTGHGALFGDYDGDGRLDLLVASTPSPTLYRNVGRGKRAAFEDVSGAVGLDRVRFTAAPEGAAWVDFDGDGDLDLYFAVYEAPVGQGHPDVLLENRGRDGFVDVSAELGIVAAGPWCGRGVSPYDCDGDGVTEVFVSDYRLQPNLCWDFAEGVMAEIASGTLLAGREQPPGEGAFGHTIGACWGDVDGDGTSELFLANLAHPRFVRQGFSNLSMLLFRDAAGAWRDEALLRGIRFQETHSDPAFVDYDADGDLDLSITCVYEGVPSLLLQNDGKGRFRPVTVRSGAVVFHGWGQSWLDYDRDGFLDLVVASDGGVRVFRNLGNDHHHLKVRLRSRGGGPFAYGATVRVTTLDAEPPQVWVRQLQPIRGTTSQDEPLLYFGLGDYDGRLQVEVRWPGDGGSTVETTRADRLLRIRG